MAIQQTAEATNIFLFITKHKVSKFLLRKKKATIYVYKYYT